MKKLLLILMVVFFLGGCRVVDVNVDTTAPATVPELKAVKEQSLEETLKLAEGAGYDSAYSGAQVDAAVAEHLAGTVTITDDESTNDNHELVFTTDNANLESDGTTHYNPSTGTITATEFSGGGAGLTSLDGEQIQDDTIDDDSIDFTDVTLLDFGLAATHDTAAELDALYEAELDNSAGLLAALSDETGTGVAVFATSPTLVTPTLGTITAGVGTALTALNGENIQDDTIDDDSIDFTDVTLLDFGLATTHDTSTELDALYEAEIVNSAGFAAALSDETGTGVAVLATSPTLVTPSLGTINSGVGTALTALNGENIQDDTIDDDSIDFSDVTAADLTFAAGDITDDTIQEPDLNSTNAPTDNYVLSYNQAGTNFTWVAAGAGSGTMTTIKENDAGVGGADIVTLDFLGADFDLAETPDTEIQVVVAAAMMRDAEWTSATTSAEGKVELATGAEAVTGTDTDRAVTPDALTDRIAAPGAIGGTTPGTGAFTTVSTTGALTVGTGGDAADAGTIRLKNGDIIAWEDGTETTITHVDDEGLAFNAPIYIAEQAEANTDTAGFGQIWVNTAEPNELWWTDDAGTDTQLGVSALSEDTVESYIFDADTETVSGVWTWSANIEFGHASDTTIARSGAGAITIEGVEILKAGDALDGETITNDTIDDDSIDFADVTLADFGLAATHDTAGELDALYEGELTNSAGLLAALSDETGTGVAVFSTSPTLVTPTLGTINSGVGTALTALNGENIQDDTIDDDSIDFTDVTAADLTFAAGDITDNTIQEPDINSTNAPTDNYVLTYNAAGTNFTWAEDATGGTPATADISDVSVTQTEFAELETIGATTISAAQWTALGGATTAGLSILDDANVAAMLVTQGLTATAAEINTPLDGASVTLTEFQELETVGATTISANQWAALGGIAETLTSTELDYVDGVTSAIQTQINAQEAELDNEAGLYAALSDVTNFLQTGDALAGDDITDGSVDGSEIDESSLVLTELIDSDDYVDGSIDNAHLADNAVDSDELAAGSVDQAHFAVDVIGVDEMANADHGMVSWNAGAATVEDFAANADADMGDFDVHSVDGLYGVDDDVYLDLGTQGKSILAADTTVEILASDEDLTFADGGANLITIGTNTGVTEINTTLQLVTTGDIMGGINVSSKAGAYTVGTDDAHEAYGTLFTNSNVANLTLPATEVVGMSGCIMQEAGITGIITLQPAGGAHLVLDGVEMTDGTDLSSGGAATDRICWVCISSDHYLITSSVGTWAE